LSSAASTSSLNQGGGGHVPDPSSLLGRGGAQRDEQMGLAGAGVPEQNQWLPCVDPRPAGQVCQGSRGQVGQHGRVEVGQAFGPGELGLVDSSDPAPGVADVALGEQDFGQESLVGQAFPGGSLGDPRRFGADRG